jgi:predicted amidohydrolase
VSERIKVAAWQAPLAACRAADVVSLIREQIARCEAEGVEILCCPEAIIGGLADDADDPRAIAIAAAGGALARTLAPLAHERIATIVGFTELDPDGRLFNSAAVFARGAVAGVYRKLYPFINRSVYTAGEALPVFAVGGLTFGIMICLDSNYVEPAAILAARGATAIFVPTNNGLPPGKASPDIVALARTTDIARAIENRVTIVRADVAGETKELSSHGSSAIVDPDGRILAAGDPMSPGLLVAEIEVAPRRTRPGWDAASNPAVVAAYRRLVAGEGAG